jgi:hypothetical protein
VDGAYQQFFNGNLDDLWIYSRAVTPAEIQALMQTPVNNPAGVYGNHAADDLRLDRGSGNPFRSRVRLLVTLPAAGEWDLQIFDTTGKRVRILERGFQDRGRHTAEWDGKDDRGRVLPSGRYFARLMFGEKARTVSLSMIR